MPAKRKQSKKGSQPSDKKVKTDERANLTAIHADVILRESPISGWGLVATKKIKAGEVIWDDPAGNEYIATSEEILSWPKKKREMFLHWAYQIGPNQWSGAVDANGDVAVEPSDAMDRDGSNFMNHSCDPTVWYDGLTRLVARRDINPGEEICYDYGTCETFEWPEDLRSPMSKKCLCGTKLCRGKVTANDWKLPELRQRYGTHWVPYIYDMIKADGAKQPEEKKAGRPRGRPKGAIPPKKVEKSGLPRGRPKGTFAEEHKFVPPKSGKGRGRPKGRTVQKDAEPTERTTRSGLPPTEESAKKESAKKESAKKGKKKADKQS